MLYEYADEKNISHSKVGKYIVASQAGELNALEKLFPVSYTHLTLPTKA